MSDVKNILLATDLSDANKKAVAHAKQLQQKYSARLSVVYAIPVPSFYSFKRLSYEEIQNELMGKYQPHFEEFLKSNELLGVENYLKVGEISDVICRLVSDHEFDLLVLGSHGEHGVRAQAGSTILKLLQRSPCNIFIANSH